MPDQERKDVGLGLSLPTYASGPTSVGWWAVWITMLGDSTAFASLVFGFFFYWTARPDFITIGADHATGAAVALGVMLFVVSWAATVLAREVNKRSHITLARLALALAATCTVGGAGLIILSVLDL